MAPNRAATRERLKSCITFTCYGARLHGDESGSVDRHHNLGVAGCWSPTANVW